MILTITLAKCILDNENILLSTVFTEGFLSFLNLPPHNKWATGIRLTSAYFTALTVQLNTMPIYGFSDSFIQHPKPDIKEANTHIREDIIPFWRTIMWTWYPFSNWAWVQRSTSSKSKIEDMRTQYSYLMLKPDIYKDIKEANTHIRKDIIPFSRTIICCYVNIYFTCSLIIGPCYIHKAQI